MTLYIMQFCKSTNTLTRLICVSAFGFQPLTCWRFGIDWVGLQSMLSWCLIPSTEGRPRHQCPCQTGHWTLCTHTHTHTQTQPHLHARDWNQLVRHSSMNQMSATSHRERRGARVNYYREKSYYFTCKTCYPGYLWIMKSFSFFPSWDKPRGDTISMSRSLKAVINFVMDVFFFPLGFAYHFMELFCVCFSKAN